MEITYPGVNGVALKRLGFRALKVNVELIIVGATKAAVGTSKDTLLTSLSQLARYTITMPEGTSLPGCKYESGMMGPWMSFNGRFACLVPLTFRQYSKAN